MITEYNTEVLAESMDGRYKLVEAPEEPTIEVTFTDLKFPDERTFVFSGRRAGYVYKMLRSLEVREVKDLARSDINGRYGNNTQWE